MPLAADLGQGLDGGVDISFGIEVAEAETHSSGRVSAKRLVCVWRAMQPDSRFYAVFKVQTEGCISAVDVERLYRYYTCAAFDAFEPDYLQLASFLKRNESVKKSFCKSEFMCRNGIEPFFLYPFKACVKSDYSRNIHCTRFESVRHEIRDLLGVAYGARTS